MGNENEIITDKVINKSEEKFHYILKYWKSINDFYILNDMSEYVKLVQLMKILRNVRNYVTIGSVWLPVFNLK